MKRSTALFVVLILTATFASAQTAMDMKHDEKCPMMKMSEMDGKLQALVDDMNKAEGQAKVDKMAAVINELVAQRAMMQAQMKSMDNCPMMKKTSSKKSSAKPMACH